MKLQSFAQTLKIKNPEQVFDLVCFGNFIAGNLDKEAPVEDSREAYQHIKKLIIKQWVSLQESSKPRLKSQKTSSKKSKR